MYGCIYPKPGGGSSADQGRKYLVLYEVETKIFFLGACPHWRRVTKDAECADFDHTKDDQVSRLSTDLEDNQKQKMIDMWACSETARALIGDWSRAQREAAKPPPSLKIARAKAEEARKQEERARVAREKEEARRRQMEREKAAGAAVDPAARAARVDTVASARRRHRRVTRRHRSSTTRRRRSSTASRQ